MLLLTLGIALPALGTVVLGAALDLEALLWLGVPVGVLDRRCRIRAARPRRVPQPRRRGPELLYLMRVGQEHRAQPGEEASVLDAMPRSRRRLVLGCVTVGCIALFPQALVPTVMKLSGDVARVWFLALYMPAAVAVAHDRVHVPARARGAGTRLARVRS